MSGRASDDGSTRVESFVLGWARRYTNGLPSSAAERRVGELRSDCHEHRVWGREVGAPPWAVTVSLAARTIAGMPADLHWRHTQLATVRDRSPRRRGRPMGRWTRDNWWLVLAALTGMFQLVMGVGLYVDEPTTGSLLGGLATALGGVVVLAGIWLRGRRRVVGDLMIGAGVMPLVVWLWTIVLPLLALAVIIPAFVDAANAPPTSETPGSARPA